jgi:hypothetical protein
MSAITTTSSERPGVGHRLAGALFGAADVWLPAAVLILPGLVWLALAGRAYPPFEPFMTGDYAKIELYTRLAAEGSQRLGTESRFHIHHLGPTFFYFAAPIYLLCGGTTKGMAVAALVWNLLFLVALLRGASRLAPRSGPLVAALLLFVFLEARGLGWLLSSWNPHVALLPFGVALLACARLATGEGRALSVLALAGSIVVQGHMVWAPPLVFAAAGALLLSLWSALRARLGIPTRGSGVGWRAIGVAGLAAALLWALPIHDEITGEYKNLRRIVTMGSDPYESRPWKDCVGPILNALELRRDGQAPGASFEWGARNAIDPRVYGGDPAYVDPSAYTRGDVVWAVAMAAALALCLVLAARRAAAVAALALVVALASVGLPVVARESPGRELPWYLLQWGAMVTLMTLLVVGVEALERVPWLGRLARGRAASVALLAIPPLLLASALRAQRAAGPPARNGRSIAVERLTAEVKAQVATADLGGRRFLVRVAPHEDQATAVGLILALDKAKLRFSVEPFGSCRIEGRFTPRGGEWAELLVGNLPARERAVRLGPPDGVSVVWQMREPSAR